MAEVDVEFEPFFTEYRKWLVRQAQALCGDRHEAEDLAQSVFLRMYCRWPTVDRPSESCGYLKRVLNSVFVDARRKAAVAREVSVGELPERPAVAGEVEAGGAVLHSLSQLPPRQRQVIFLRFWADLDVVETSRVLGCTPGTVTSQTSRGLRRLRQLLDGGRHDTDAGVIQFTQSERVFTTC
ncbi:SigE family RNA polymerase sigma factor [Saccharothrix saharensis]|uniref:SigE family RNA polymerase sigma factor n=1 Tax=Saccharothrix saharensis TaxID=571190 RepID=UPI0036D102A4